MLTAPAQALWLTEGATSDGCVGLAQHGISDRRGNSSARGRGAGELLDKHFLMAVKFAC